MLQHISLLAFLSLLLSFSHSAFSSCAAGSSPKYSKVISPSSLSQYQDYCAISFCGGISYPPSVSIKYGRYGDTGQLIITCPDQCFETCDDEPEKDNECPFSYAADNTGSCVDEDRCSIGTSMDSLTASCEPDDCETGSYAGSTGICQACPAGTDCYVPPPPTCTSDEDLINNVCVPRPPTCSGFDVLVDGVCVAPDSPLVCPVGTIVQGDSCVSIGDNSGGAGGGSTDPDPEPPVTPDPEPLPSDPDPLPEPTNNPTPDQSSSYDQSATGSVKNCSAPPSCDHSSPECRSYIIEWNQYCAGVGSNIHDLDGDFDPDSFKDSITEEIDLSQKINELSDGENWFSESCPSGYALNFSFISLDVDFEPWCSFATKTKPIFLALIFFMVGRRIVIAASGGS